MNSGSLPGRLAHFRIIPTITEPDFADISWDDETGHIDARLIRQAAIQPDAADFYIAGPPAMVDAMSDLVREMGAPAARIHAEQFAGYEEMARAEGG